MLGLNARGLSSMLVTMSSKTASRQGEAAEIWLTPQSGHARAEAPASYLMTVGRRSWSGVGTCSK